MPEISLDKIQALLKEDAAKSRGGGGRRKVDPTTVRTLQSWMKLNRRIKEDGCDNPNCIDPRPKTDKGTSIVVFVKEDKAICRYCFLDGYLL